jgi:hypothetical protein
MYTRILDCDANARFNRERGTAVGVARLDAMHPLCKFVVHVLKAGHYQTFMIAAEIIARAVATEETDVEEVLSPYVAMGARAPGGGGSWHEMVGRDEGGEGGGGDDEVTIFKERDESFGMTVSDLRPERSGFNYWSVTRGVNLRGDGGDSWQGTLSFKPTTIGLE